MNYLHLMQKGLRVVVKEALKYVEQNGLHGLSYFYITFKPTYSGAFVPQYLINKHPDKMTIILQHEFWDLAVEDAYFTVSLLFNGTLENLKIPFNAIYRFEDPSEPLALDFLVDSADEAQESSKDVNRQDNIISLDSFRKNKEPKN